MTRLRAMRSCNPPPSFSRDIHLEQPDNSKLPAYGNILVKVCTCITYSVAIYLKSYTSALKVSIVKDLCKQLHHNSLGKLVMKLLKVITRGWKTQYQHITTDYPQFYCFPILHYIRKDVISTLTISVSTVVAANAGCCLLAPKNDAQKDGDAVNMVNFNQHYDKLYIPE